MYRDEENPYFKKVALAKQQLENQKIEEEEKRKLEEEKKENLLKEQNEFLEQINEVIKPMHLKICYWHNNHKVCLYPAWFRKTQTKCQYEGYINHIEICDVRYMFEILPNHVESVLFAEQLEKVSKIEPPSNDERISKKTKSYKSYYFLISFLIISILALIFFNFKILSLPF